MQANGGPARVCARAHLVGPTRLRYTSDMSPSLLVPLCVGLLALATPQPAAAGATAPGPSDPALAAPGPTAPANDVGIASHKGQITRGEPLFEPTGTKAQAGSIQDVGHDPNYDGSGPMDERPADRRGRAEDEAKAREDAEQPIGWIIEDRKAPHRAHLLSFGLGLWPETLSTQLWYAVPLTARGLLPRVNDGFDLEFGSLFAWGRGNTLTLWPAVGVRWDFYLTRRWAVYFNLKFAVQILLNYDQAVHPNAIVGFGGLLRLAERLLLRLELNYPQGVTVGLSIPLGGP